MDYSDDPVIAAGMRDSWLRAEGHGADPDRYLIHVDRPRCVVRVSPPLEDRAASLAPIVVVGEDDYEFSVVMWFDQPQTAEEHQGLLDVASRVWATWND